MASKVQDMSDVEKASKTPSSAAPKSDSSGSVPKADGKAGHQSKRARRRSPTATSRAATAPTRRSTAAVVGAAAAGLTAGLLVQLGRKAIAQAPSVAAGDWLEALKAEHQMALTLFDHIQETSNSQSAKRSLLLAQLKHALGKHAFAEENVVYPALRAWGDKADADKLNHDHGYVKQHLYDLENLDAGSPEFLDRLATFRADLEGHIREEEDAIFPPLHAALGETGNMTLTAQVNTEAFKLA